MALDSNGNPYISYYSNSDSLMMAFKDQEGWHRSVVDTPIGYRFQESAICIDADDYAHITFRNHDLSALRYAWQNAGGSHKMTVTDLESLNFSCDMDLKPDGFARIVFYDGEDSSVKYARRSASGWMINTVDDARDCGFMASLLISDTGHAHMTYMQLDTPRALLYATNKASRFPDITVQLTLPETEIYRHSPFWLEAAVINPSDDIASAPFVCVLDVLGQYFFYPSWSAYPPDFDYSDEALPVGTTRLVLIPEIEWPDGAGELSGIFFHAAVLTDDMSALRGNMASIEWGYYEF